MDQSERMQSFHFSCGPRLVAASGAAGRLGALKPEGRCLFPTEDRMRREAQGFAEHLDAICQRGGVLLRLSRAGAGGDHLDLLVREAMKQERVLINIPRAIREAGVRLGDVAL